MRWFWRKNVEHYGFSDEIANMDISIFQPKLFHGRHSSRKPFGMDCFVVPTPLSTVREREQ